MLGAQGQLLVAGAMQPACRCWLVDGEQRHAVGCGCSSRPVKGCTPQLATLPCSRLLAYSCFCSTLHRSSFHLLHSTPPLLQRPVPGMRGGWHASGGGPDLPPAGGVCRLHSQSRCGAGAGAMWCAPGWLVLLLRGRAALPPCDAGSRHLPWLALHLLLPRVSATRQAVVLFLATRLLAITSMFHRAGARPGYCRSEDEH